MTPIRWTHLLAAVFGLMMAAAAGVQAHGPAFAAAALGVVAVLVGIRFRSVATVAVLLAMAAVVLSDTPPMLAALAGLSAAAYLVLRYADSGPAGVVTASAPAMIAALGFTIVGLVATAFPFQVPWLPLLAPLAVVGIYVLVIRPFVSSRS
ncbi:MAG: hypothetical protein ACRDU5_21680 [Mycobacterium sp.]